MTKPVLLVAVRGWTTSGEWLLFGRPGGEISPKFIAALAPLLPDTEIWAPDLGLEMFSMRAAESLSRELFDKIGQKVASTPGIERIILLGYSAGSLLTRRVFCMAHGALPDGTVSGDRAIWADMIDRVVMLSGITRGWEFSSASPAHVRFLGPVLNQLTRLVGLLKSGRTSSKSNISLIQQLKRGSPFVVSSRIQYINVFEALRQRESKGGSPLRINGLPSTVFLLGAKDEYISPADCTELGPRVEFAFVELEGSNHTDALLIAGNDPAATKRRCRLAAVIGQAFATLAQEPWTIPAEDINDYLDPMDVDDGNDILARHDGAKRPVGHAVIVMHGIRDNGFWTKRVAREIKTLARRSDLVVRTPTPSYGYFSMWEFIKPGGRERATYWFMERYADVKTYFPHAKISFVGHSNGTYLAAHALELCSAVRFENVVFAGSVVRRKLDWQQFRGRVGRVLNYVAARDKVVAFLPAVFELSRLRWLDVGGAGAFGFETKNFSGVTSGTDAKDVELRQFLFVDGGHGAAIAEQFWPEIAGFALLGTVPDRAEDIRTCGTNFLFKCAPVFTVLIVVSAIMLLAMPLIVAALFAGYVAKHEMSYQAAVIAAAVAVSIGLFLSWLLGRFLRTW
jgi:pimeloyl-ACP methyl ester carboxylesterase